MSEHNKNDMEFYIQIVAIVVLVGLLMYGVGKSSSIENITSSVIGIGGTIGVVSASEILPTGIPLVYGNELKIRYDDVTASNPQSSDTTISVMADIDRSETLTGEDLDRYIDVLYNLENGISCEFCCGARSVIRNDGTSACGCAHSFAMRGLAKYLIKFHGDEFSDEEILEEVAKWKVLFFPGIHETKAAVLKSEGIELNFINLGSNKYRGIEEGQQSGGGMVGGC